LKPELEKMKGFISIERFQSIYHPEKILSLSFWEDEKATQQWRNLETHRVAWSKGREYIFKDTCLSHNSSGIMICSIERRLRQIAGHFMATRLNNRLILFDKFFVYPKSKLI
jgi:hypothetical protein